MSYLTREEFLAKKPSIVNVDLPNGDKVRIKEWSAADRVEFSKDDENFAAKLILYSVCDESGVLLFQEADLSALTGVKASYFSPIVRDVLKLQGLTKDEAKLLGKNSESSPC